MTDHKINPAEQTTINSSSRGWIITFSILLSLSLLLTLVSISMNQSIFEADVYSEFLNEQGFYDEFPALVTDAILTNSQGSLANSPLFWLSRDQTEEFIKAVLPSEWVKQQTEIVLQSVMSFVNLQQENLLVVIDLQAVKDNLTGPAGKQAVMNLLTGLPECSLEQLNLIIVAVQSGQTGFELCNPPVNELLLLDMVLDPIMKEIADAVPPSIILPTNEQAQIILNLTQSPAFQVYRYARTGLAVLPWACLILILLIVILGWRSLRWMMNGFSFSFILAGLAGALPGGWFFLQGKQLSAEWVSAFNISGLGEIGSLVVNLVQQVIQTAGRTLLIWSLGALLLGLVFLAVRSFAKQ